MSCLTASYMYRMKLKDLQRQLKNVSLHNKKKTPRFNNFFNLNDFTFIFSNSGLTWLTC